MMDDDIHGVRTFLNRTTYCGLARQAMALLVTQNPNVMNCAVCVFNYHEERFAEMELRAVQNVQRVIDQQEGAE